MAGPARPDRLMTVEEYLEFERRSPVKHEYVGGHVYAMTGVSRRHSLIAGNVLIALRTAARGTGCRVHQSDMRVPTPDGPYYYPDIVVACGGEPEDPLVEDAPCLIVEIVSPSTELTDRREKLLSYRRIPTLQAYLIVELERMMVERHYCDASGRWQSELHGVGMVPLPCPTSDLALAAIYEEIPDHGE